MEDELDLILGEHPFEQRSIEDRPGNLPVDLRRDRMIESRKIERDNGPAGLGREPFDQAVPDLTARPGDQHDWFAHGEIILNGSCSLCFSRCSGSRLPAASRK